MQWGGGGPEWNRGDAVGGAGGTVGVDAVGGAGGTVGVDVVGGGTSGAGGDFGLGRLSNGGKQCISLDRHVDGGGGGDGASLLYIDWEIDFFFSLFWNLM